MAKVEKSEAEWRAALTPAKVECTEAHGTGTALGDPTEAGALAAVYGSAGRATPLSVGALKRRSPRARASWCWTNAVAP